MLISNMARNIFPHKLFSMFVSNFSPYQVCLSKNTVIKYAFEAAKRILTNDALNPHLR